MKMRATALSILCFCDGVSWLTGHSQPSRRLRHAGGTYILVRQFVCSYNRWWRNLTFFLTAAFLLPFGSGSAPAAKGVITRMCADSQRANALNAVTLVENIARLATQGLFGFVFASLVEVGKAYATFFCNAVSKVMESNITLLC